MSLKEKLEEILDLDWEVEPVKYRELIVHVYEGLHRFKPEQYISGHFASDKQFLALRGKIDIIAAQRQVRVKSDDKAILREIKELIETFLDGPGAMKSEEEIEEEITEDVEFGDE